jgi:hypothetical protein
MLSQASDYSLKPMRLSIKGKEESQSLFFSYSLSPIPYG